MRLLTHEQIQDLAEILVEECGPCLSGDESSEQIALLLEDIAGFESASDSDVHQIIIEIGRNYHDAIQHLKAE